MIRFEPEPTPELRAARQALIVGFFLRALGPSSLALGGPATRVGQTTAVPNWRSAGPQPAGLPVAVGGLTKEEQHSLAALRNRVEVVA